MANDVTDLVFTVNFYTFLRAAQVAYNCVVSVPVGHWSDTHSSSSLLVSSFTQSACRSVLSKQPLHMLTLMFSSLVRHRRVYLLLECEQG